MRARCIAPLSTAGVAPTETMTGSPQRRAHVAQEEIRDVERPLPGCAARADPRIQQRAEQRPLGGRIVVGHAARKRTAVADRQVTDLARRHRENRELLPDQRRPLDRTVAHQRADAQTAVVRLDEVQTLDAVDVDERARAHQPEVEHRDQTLSARQDLRVPVVAR
jgi:hypothetical protein